MFPWFGAREGFPNHGFARVTEWDWDDSSAAPDGSVTLRFRLPDSAERAADSSSENVTFSVTVSDKLTMELTVANPSRTESLSFENCLHTYFTIGDIAEVEITGLKGATCIDRVGNVTERVESADAIRINSETDRVYFGHHRSGGNSRLQAPSQNSRGEKRLGSMGCDAHLRNQALGREASRRWSFR